MSTRNLALIGAGYWGKNLARNFHSLGALHTLGDLNPAILASYGDDYSEVNKTGDINSIWGDPAITQVAIAAPAAHHYQLTEAALLAGKDVYVEKPLCLHAAEADHLVVLARERGRILMVGHLLQYHPMVRQLQSWVRQGELGLLQYISSHRLSLGKFRREENVLWSFAPHDLSVILSLAGDLEPEKVICTGGSFLTPNVEDAIVTHLAFAGGLRAHVYANWLNPFKEQKLTAVGSKAMAVFDDTKPWAEKLAIYRGGVRQGPDGPVPYKVAPEYAIVPEAEPLREECLHFLGCCQTRSVPRTDGKEGLRVLRVLQAAQASLERNRT
jgi:UDP-2-acetamido-3-amino-2,3-dideoxy-glucuronate N-acetyltransferase